jgi:hypothetical protein
MELLHAPSSWSHQDVMAWFSSSALAEITQLRDGLLDKKTDGCSLICMDEKVNVASSNIYLELAFASLLGNLRCWR